MTGAGDKPATTTPHGADQVSIGSDRFMVKRAEDRTVTL